MSGGEGRPDAEPFDPVSVEAAIRATTNDIAKGVHIVSDAHERYLAAKRAHDAVEDRAYFSAEGSVEDRKRKARQAAEAERAVMDAAEVAHKRALGTARALSERLMALMSAAKMVERMYGAAGIGDR